VYGVFFAISGEGYAYEEIKDYADFLKRELLLVEGVAGVEIWGDQQEVIYLEISRARMAELGISMEMLVTTLNRQNRLVAAGRVQVDGEHVRIHPSGEFQAVEDLGNLLISSDGKGNLVYLKDVVTIRRGYQDPPQWMMRHNGRQALGLGISTVAGGNVVEMGKAVKERIQQLESEAPVGMELDAIAYQSDLVSASIKAFVVNLVEAVAIVIAVLCLTMGFSSGMLMGTILLLTILGTLIVMQAMAIDLQMISLGALILALGMLVDNAIVVTEGILVRVQQGMARIPAALETVRQTALPLMGATFVAVLAFAAIGTSTDTTGEFLKSLFLVMGISLGLSWVLAITLTPLFCVQFLPRQKSGTSVDPYQGRVFILYRRFLDACLRHRLVSLAVLGAMMMAAVVGFGFVENNFFPNDSRNQFMINFWGPEGTHIVKTAADLERMEAYLADMDGVTATTTFVGQGALRFVLTYDPQVPNTSYGQILVTVNDQHRIDGMMATLRRDLAHGFPDAQIMLKKFVRGPDIGGKIEARFQGPDAAVLRKLADAAKAIMAADPVAVEVHDDWRQQVLVLRPQVAEATARRLGITRPQIADALAMNFSGRVIGLYREENRLIPMVVQAPADEGGTANQIDNISLVSPLSGAALPLRQVVTDVQTDWDDAIIRRENRARTITAICNPGHGNASVLFNRLKPQIEAMELPRGYGLQWGGEYENSSNAQAGLMQMMPLFFLAMVFTVVALFNAVRQTVIIFLCLPLASIGVAAGLLLFQEPFGFMCLLGFIGLSGMLIKNAVVLIDQIDLEIREGKDPYTAVLDSSVSRLRPVTMAALTTALGMLPLLSDVFFAGMSVTIIGGLSFGTVLTMVVVPVLYASFFRIRRAPETVEAN
jgi:multidrug efflux pump subunit AcrB